MGRRVRGPWEADYFREYKRLGPIAKLATSYIREVPAVALGILERRLSVQEMFQIQMA
jgi:hypothetical protein